MLNGLILYAQFFTRISIPVEIQHPEEKFKNNIQYFSLFGIILGLIEAAIFWVWCQIFPVWFAWVLFLIGDGIITGGFHLDALADSADGIFSSRTVDKMLTIMKDSRLGTMGTLALFYFYAIMMGLGVCLSNAQFSTTKMSLLAAVVIMYAKTGISLNFYKMKYAGKGGGLASIWEGISTWRIVVDQVFAMLVTFLTLGFSGIIAYLAVFIVDLLYRHYIYGLFNGMTGDTVGCFAEISQVVFLLVYAGINLSSLGGIL